MTFKLPYDFSYHMKTPQLVNIFCSEYVVFLEHLMKILTLIVFEIIITFYCFSFLSLTSSKLSSYLCHISFAIFSLSWTFFFISLLQALIPSFQGSRLDRLGSKTFSPASNGKFLVNFLKLLRPAIKCIILETQHLQKTGT